MGIRLSLRKASKEIEDKLTLWPADKESELHDFINENAEDMLYDFCTDAMYDIYEKWIRLTNEKFEFECDFTYGKMRKKEFLDFIAAVKARATKQIDEACKGDYKFPNGELVLPYYFKTVDVASEESNKWRLCFSIDWISAYYQCLYIYKIFDWEHDFIIWELS